MIDGIKFSVLDNDDIRLLNNPLLDFEQRNIGRDGELLPVIDEENKIKLNKEGKTIFKTPYVEATFQNLTFKKYDNGYTEVSGSLHKYFNEGKHNFNKFSKDDLENVLNTLKRKFGISLEHTRIHSIEFGVNLNLLPYDTSTILDHCLMHSTTLFEEKYNSYKGKYIQAVHSQMILKVYDKAKQYRGKGFEVNSETLRIEVKVLRMDYLNKKGVYLSSLQDLYNLDYWLLISQLIREWERILFYDFTCTIKRPSYLQYRDKIFWKEKLKRPSRSAFEKHRSKLRKLIKNSSKQVQTTISGEIRKEAETLMRGTENDNLCIR